MKWMVVVVLAAAALAAAEPERMRPQPRQIFRDGFDDERGGAFNPRRPTLKDLRQRQEQLSIGDLPLGPRPDHYDREDHQDDDPQHESFVHTPPGGEDKSVSHGPEVVYTDEENTAHLEEYHQDDDEYITEDHPQPTMNYVDEEEEGEEHAETRSPAHRYPDEDSPSSRSAKDSSTSESDQFVTTIPLLENDFNPFSLFEAGAGGGEGKSGSYQDSGEDERLSKQPSSKFELTTSPYSERRFSGSASAAQERNYETRASGREHGGRQPEPAYNQRPTSRHSPRPHVSQPLNHNLIPRDPYYEEQRPSRPVSQHRPQPIRQHHLQQQQQQGGAPAHDDYSDYEEEEEKPDRLSELLLQSKFTCGGQNDGYYADEDVNCEVFHFCQDGVKHSWLCPNGAAFHQVHLICMPHSDDNICERSSKFHFVNDFLYKEVGDNPENRGYVQRYYPQGYEGGVANIPDHPDGGPPVQAARPPQYNRHRQPTPPSNYQSRQEGDSHRSQPQHPQQPRTTSRQQAKSRDHRPVRQDESYQSQEINKPPFVVEKVKPQYHDDEKRKFELTRPKFDEFVEERPSFEIEPKQPQQVEHERAHIDPFSPIHEGRPKFEGQQRLQQPEIVHPEQDFVDKPSAHFQQHRPQPQFGPPQHSREQPAHLRPQPHRPTGGETPVYHPQQAFHHQQNRGLHGSPSVKHQQFRLPQEGRRPPIRKEASINPLSFLG